MVSEQWDILGSFRPSFLRLPDVSYCDIWYFFFLHVRCGADCTRQIQNVSTALHSTHLLLITVYYAANRVVKGTAIVVKFHNPLSQSKGQTRGRAKSYKKHKVKLSATVLLGSFYWFPHESHCAECSRFCESLTIYGVFTHAQSKTQAGRPGSKTAPSNYNKPAECFAAAVPVRFLGNARQSA